MACLKVRDFGPKDFAQYHPGGSLGRQLMSVTDVMRQERRCLGRTPQSIERALEIMTQTEGRPGAVCIVSSRERPGLARFSPTVICVRLWAKTRSLSTLKTPSTPSCIALLPPFQIQKWLREAARILAQKHLDQLPVINSENWVVGLLDIQDLLTLGFTP